MLWTIVTIIIPASPKSMLKQYRRHPIIKACMAITIPPWAVPATITTL